MEKEKENFDYLKIERNKKLKELGELYAMIAMNNGNSFLKVLQCVYDAFANSKALEIVMTAFCNQIDKLKIVNIN